ncbi:hypothetical protein ACX0G7_20455 [Flavitalea antarctica]
MKFLKGGALFALGLMAMTSAIGQKVKLIEGDLSAVKNEKSINTEFTYDKMKVGKFDDEAEYVSKKKEEYNKKEPGRGDTWATRWVDDREERFEPQFNELFEKTSMMTITPKSKYTLIYKTTFTEPGFNIGVMRKNATIDGEAWIVETADRNKVIAKISVAKAPGRIFGGFDFDTGERIQEAYAMAGRAVAKMIVK